jgi:hypothetical protein
MPIGKGEAARQQAFHGPFVAFRKIDDPILLALSAVVSKGADTGAASAQTTTQEWTTGWDNFGEPLDLTHSNIKWSVSGGNAQIDGHLYVGRDDAQQALPGWYSDLLHHYSGTFGQFPTNPGAGNCGQITKQGVTASVASVEMGVVTTDLRGNGSFKVVVGPIASAMRSNSTRATVPVAI